MKTNMKAEDLRKSIYQRAIQGKLVPQDPNDEPASVLLERIKAEKDQLIKAGKIKRDKNESYIFKGDDNRYYEKIGKEVKDITDDLPFGIPESWMWVRLPELVNYKLGKTPDRNNQTYWGKDIPWVSIADMKEKETITTTKENISEKAFADVFSGNISPNGTLLMSFKLTVGRVSILGMDAEHNEAIISIFPYLDPSNITRDYLFYALGELVNYCEKTDAIKGATLNKEKMNKMFIPIPPLQEQIRVINRIRVVEPYINKYDLFETELTSLENNFPEQLKKSILQYAIQGKLVPQDPNDEPASVLLERIKTEKEQLIKEGKIKRDKNESVIYQGDDKNYYEKIGKEVKDITDDLPFEIPDSWAWMRLPELASYKLGKTPDRNNSKLWGKDIPWVSIADMKEKETITTTKERISKKAFTEIFSGKISPKGTLLMSFKLTVGRVSILGMDAEHNEAIISIFPYIDPTNIIRDYLFYALGELVNYCEKTDAIKGTTLNKEKMNKMLIPVPPLFEQKRIVSVVAYLFNTLQAIIGSN